MVDEINLKIKKLIDQFKAYGLIHQHFIMNVGVSDIAISDYQITRKQVKFREEK